MSEKRKIEKVDPNNKKGSSKEELEEILRNWRGRLGMGDWDIDIEIVDFKRKDYRQSGDFVADPNKKTGTILITWNPFVKEEDSLEKEESKTVLHELIHIMLWEVDSYAEQIILERYDKYGKEHMKHIANIEELVDHLVKILIE